MGLGAFLNPVGDQSLEVLVMSNSNGYQSEQSQFTTIDHRLYLRVCPAAQMYP
jgi:hypothetical protein